MIIYLKNQFSKFFVLSYAYTLQSHETKLDPRARNFVLLGYKSGVKGFVLSVLHSREIFIFRNVIF